jgi:6-phosphofructokinase 1
VFGLVGMMLGGRNVHGVETLGVQDLMASLSKETDASGNPILGDIGVHLTKEV